MNASPISRRALLLSSASLVGCGHKKATGFRGICFVANQAERSLTVVDLTRFRVRRQIPLDAAPSAVLAHPTQPKLYVLAPEAGTVFEVDAVTLAVTRRARGGNLAIEMRMAPARDALWVLYRDPPGLVEVPLDSLRPRYRVPTLAPDTFEIGDTGHAAIACARDRVVEVTPLPDGPGRTIHCADEPSLVLFRKDGRQVLVGSRPARVLTIFEVASGNIVVRLPLPVEPRHFAVNSDGGQVFITGDGMDAVVVVYPYQTEIGETFLAGRAPDCIATSDSPEYLLVANPETNTITALDFENDGKLIASVDVGQEPRHIILTPARAGQDQYALVLNQASNDMAVVRINALANSDPLRRYQPRAVFTMVPVGRRPVSAAVVAFS